MEMAHQLVPWVESLSKSPYRDKRKSRSSNAKHVKPGNCFTVSYSMSTAENETKRRHKMGNQGEDSSLQRNKVFLLIGLVAAGFAFCAVIRTFVCKKYGKNCPC
jgi:hypothetical protein